ncbi:MAG: hypothetical protein JWO03_3850 [Bacteroidetes bacterium]|nr:hypothetical protein [Bacteroidota bacterium]
MGPVFINFAFMKNTLTKEGKQEVLDRLDKLTETTERKWGSMLVNQMLAHMNDAHKIALGMKAVKDTSTFFSHNIMFPAAVYILPSWPKGEKTAPELDQKQEGTKARNFYTELEFLKKMMDIFEEREATKMHPHPMFGQLTKKQWADLLKKHFDHHLRQFSV